MHTIILEAFIAAVKIPVLHRQFYADIFLFTAYIFIFKFSISAWYIRFCDTFGDNGAFLTINIRHEASKF